MKQMALPLRKDLKIEETWDLSLLFDNQESYEEAVSQLKLDLEAFANNYKGKLANKELISQAILDYNQLEADGSPIFNYGTLGYSVDRLNEIYERNADQVGDLVEFYGKHTAFFMPELASLEESTLKAIKELEEMEDYQAFFDNLIRIKPSLLDADKEEMLSALQGSILGQEDLYASIKFQDMVFDDFQVGDQTYENSFAGFEQDYEPHPNRQVRYKAWESFHQGLARYQHTAAANYINRVKTEKKLAKLRGFDSVFDYLLFEQNVDQASYHQIIDTLMKDMAPVMQRYAQLMKQEQGWDQISLADIKANFSKGEPAEISIAKSREMVQAALGVLGSEYGQMVERAFTERWIDYPMNQTKTTGGFCASPYRKPSFILLNWTGLLSEVLVLAHELGHAGHFYFAAKNNPALTTEASLYFIEAPSTCNEVITFQYLLNQPLENSEKRSLVAEFISRTYFHNMVTHLLEAAFQRKVYQAVDREDLLNAKVLNTYFKEVLEEFWGDSLEINDGAELTWMRQPHYFGGLYSYTYSAGLSIGTQIGQKIAAGDQMAVEAWLKVLSAGGSQGPLELAKMAGVDMSGAQPIQEAVKFVDKLLDQIESLV